MDKKNIKKIGIVALKIGLTVVAFVIAAGLASSLSNVLIGQNYASLSIVYIFLISMIIPIWYGAPIRWRIAAASSGIAAGMAAWLISLFVVSPDIALTSNMIGFIRAGAFVISLAVCVSILRAGRSKKGLDPV